MAYGTLSDARGRQQRKSSPEAMEAWRTVDDAHDVVGAAILLQPMLMRIDPDLALRLTPKAQAELTAILRWAHQAIGALVVPPWLDSIQERPVPPPAPVVAAPAGTGGTRAAVGANGQG